MQNAPLTQVLLVLDCTSYIFCTFLKYLLIIECYIRNPYCTVRDNETVYSSFCGVTEYLLIIECYIRNPYCTVRDNETVYSSFCRVPEYLLIIVLYQEPILYRKGQRGCLFQFLWSYKILTYHRVLYQAPILYRKGQRDCLFLLIIECYIRHPYCTVRDNETVYSYLS